MNNCHQIDFHESDDQLTHLVDEKLIIEHRLNLLNETILGLCFYSNLTECLRDYLCNIVSVDEIDVACIFSVDVKNEQLNLEACSDYKNIIPEITAALSGQIGYKFAVKSLPVYYTLRELQNILGLTSEEAYQCKATAFIPIINGTSIVAVLVAGSKQTASWSYHTIETLEMLARPVGFVMNRFCAEGIQLKLNFIN